MFTDEQKAAIAEIVTTSLKAAAPAAAAPAAAPAAKASEQKSIAQQVKEEIEAGKQKSIVDQAKDAVEAEKNSQVSLVQLNESVRFNIGVKDFVEKNKNLLPIESPKILEAIEAKTYKDDNEKANTTRKNLLDSFLSQKENLAVMTASMQSRAEAYKALAESDKERKSSEFWDLAEVGIALKTGAQKAEALKHINGGSAEGSSGIALDDKTLSAANAKFNSQK